MVALFSTPICAGEIHSSSNNLIEVAEKPTGEDMIDNAIKDMQLDMNAINNITDKKEWFIAYKSVIEKYSDTLDSPETIYDYFTEEELNLLFCVVEAEATEGNFEEKANVASVIFNRINHDKFGETLEDILTIKQFSVLSDGRAYQIEITEDAILACEYAFQIEDTTNGAIFFEKGSDVHAAYAEYLFTDAIGHKFYK